MKKFLNIFFVTLGIIFFILILYGVYFYVADPLNLKPLLFDKDYETTESNEVDSTKTNPALTEGQNEALQKIGVDPSKLPTSLTAEQEACVITKIDSPRVVEIKNGATLTLSEYLAAKDCF